MIVIFLLSAMGCGGFGLSLPSWSKVRWFDAQTPYARAAVGGARSAPRLDTRTHENNENVTLIWKELRVIASMVYANCALTLKFTREMPHANKTAMISIDPGPYSIKKIRLIFLKEPACCVSTHIR